MEKKKKEKKMKSLIMETEKNGVIFLIWWRENCRLEVYKIRPHRFSLRL